MKEQKKQKQSTAGIRWWSPTQLLACRHTALSTAERTGSLVLLPDGVNRPRSSWSCRRLRRARPHERRVVSGRSFREEGDNYYVYTKVIPEALRINLNYDLRRRRVEELLRKRFLSFPFLIVKSCMISDLGDLLIHSE
jgi:hypothetical protein